MNRIALFVLAFLLVPATAQVAPFCAAFGQTQAERPAGTTVTVGPSGIRRHVSGKWATVAVNAMNRSDVDSEETVAVIIGENSNQQFARRLWVPAGATRQTWLPVQIPGGLYPEQVTVPMKTIQLRETDGKEQFQSNVVGMATSERSLLLSWDQSRTAVLFDGEDRSALRLEELEYLSKTVYAGRDSVSLSVQDLGLISLGTSLLPPSAKALDAIDHIVVAEDSVLQDTVAIKRIRSWLQSGGRIWIMVDQISPESVQALLGDAACYSIVDRVELNELEIERVADINAEQLGNVGWESEDPVEFVRVLIDTDDVQCRVNGWPAAFWKSVGHGEVLFTTLGARGWMAGDKENDAYRGVSSRFFVTRLEPPRHTKELVSYLSDEIGYEIPDRASVAGVLGLHMLVVLIAGAWLAREKKLQYLSIIVPVAAVLSAGGLIAMGNAKTAAVPSTIATSQIARALPDSAEIQVESVSSIYSQNARPLSIESTAETTTRLLEEGPGGEMRRLMWDDTGKSNWIYVNQPPGAVRHVESESIVNLPQPWLVKAKFTERGFEGRLSGLNVTSCEDAVIVSAASPSLAVAASSSEPSNFVGDSDQVLSENQFIDTTLMSDIQRDRQELLRQLTSSSTAFFGQEPTMVVWTDPVDSGVTFDEDYRRRGSSLASIPLRYERVPAGSDFRIPASFVRIDSYFGERGTSTVFNPKTGKWLDEMNRPNETDLKCVPPRILLPCELKRANVSIKINAPSRVLELKGFVDGEPVTLHRQENPTGLLEIEIDNSDALKLDSQGGLRLSIAISETEEERRAAAEPGDPSKPKAPSRSTWRIDYVHVNLEGTTL